MADARQTLERAIRERGESYAGLSQLIGRNPAYIQQFVKRGVPRRLGEGDRRTLAAYLGVDEAALGAPERSRPRVVPAGRGLRGADLVAIPRLALSASAGPGTVPALERAEAVMHVDPAWLRRVAPGGTAVSIIRVNGDSMHPVLGDGDEILVDTGDAGAALRDGVYVLRRDETLMVKRVTMARAPGRFVVSSDNGAYPPWPECDGAEVDVVGRVVWAGRRIA